MDIVDDLAVGWCPDHFDVSYALEMLTKLSQIPPLGVIELQKLLLLNQLIVQLFKILRLTWLFGLDELDKPPFKLF